MCPRWPGVAAWLAAQKRFWNCCRAPCGEPWNRLIFSLSLSLSLSLSRSLSSHTHTLSHSDFHSFAALAR